MRNYREEYQHWLDNPALSESEWAELNAIADDGVRCVGVVRVKCRIPFESVAKPNATMPGRTNRVLDADSSVLGTLAEDVLAAGAGGERDKPICHLDADILVGRRKPSVYPLRSGGLNILDELSVSGQCQRFRADG